jgi:MFS family permease
LRPVSRPARRVFAAFFLYAFSMGGLYPRLAEVQRTMGVAEGALGLALIGTATGTLLSLTVAGRVLQHLSHRTVLWLLIPLQTLCYALAGRAEGPLGLFVALVPAGLCVGLVEVVVNLEADRVEQQTGRRIMNRAHAFWSFGFFGAGLFAATMSLAGVGPASHLLAVLPLTLAGVALLLGRFEPAPQRRGSHDGVAPHFARPTRAVMALVAVTLAPLVLEGAGIDWSAILLRDAFGATPFVAGLGVTAGALAQAIARFIADPVVERHGPVRVGRWLIALSGLGALLVVLSLAVPVALLGFALIGIGTSAIFPLAMSAAAQRRDRPAAINVAALAQVSFVTFLLGPPLLGWTAQAWGIRSAFGVCLPLVLLSLAAVASLGPARDTTADGGSGH